MFSGSYIIFRYLNSQGKVYIPSPELTHPKNNRLFDSSGP